MDFGDLKVALAFAETFGRGPSHFVVMLLQLIGSVVSASLLPLRVEYAITTGEERIALDQPTVPLGNLSVQLGPQRLVNL